jgi:hypothetical protein
VEVTSASSQSVCRRVLDKLLFDTLLLDISSGECPSKGITLQSTHHTLTVQQVRVVDKEGNLKVVYPSRIDLNFEDNSISVIREWGTLWTRYYLQCHCCGIRCDNHFSYLCSFISLKVVSKRYENMFINKYSFIWLNFPFVPFIYYM